MQKDKTLLWESREVSRADVDPATLPPHPHNPKKHPKRQRRAVLGSLETLKWLRPILVNLRTSDQWGELQNKPVTLDGHLRIELAIENGQATVPVSYVDLAPGEENSALILLDETAAMWERDADNLASLMRETNSDNQQVLETMAALSKESEPKQPKPPLVCPECGHEF